MEYALPLHPYDRNQTHNVMKTVFSVLAFLIAVAIGPATRGLIRGTVTGPDGRPLSGVIVMIKGTHVSTMTDADGRYSIPATAEAKVLLFTLRGMKQHEEPVMGRTLINVMMIPDDQAVMLTQMEENPIREEAAGRGEALKREEAAGREKAARLEEPARRKEVTLGQKAAGKMDQLAPVIELVECEAYDMSYSAVSESPSEIRYGGYRHYQPREPENTESYASVSENGYMDPLRDPYSTFSIDVDNASYSNVRRFINLGQKVPVDAVRIEEMINYFRYDYPQPAGEHPIALYTEAAVCPWNSSHYLLHIGLSAREVSKSDLPPSNLVFLIDVSGSMSSANKLPLLKSAFRLLVDELREQDRVAIVVYAGATGVMLESVPGNRKEKIMEVIDRLRAAGATAGGAGLKQAYEIAEKNFMKGGNNRIILATDGDFNVGVTDNLSLEKFVESKRATGVCLTVLGFGMGNYKDDRLELLADKGNGNYAYIDNIQEARRVLVQEFGGTLFTMAKDVKLQIEFNPARVKAYRLVGYENRMLADRDFNDDRKDAGEMGSGHSVTALYEIVPAGSDEGGLPTVDPLRYQVTGYGSEAAEAGSGRAARGTAAFRKDTAGEMCNIKVRYKEPDSQTSKFLSKAVGAEIKKAGETTDRYRFSAAVAAFGMLLRDSSFKGTATRADVISLASGARGSDPDGYRAEFIRLVQAAN